jgi:subtilisin-like proprotein convertase family protein
VNLPGTSTPLRTLPILAGLAFSLAALGAPLKDSYWLAESGGVQEYEIARDEVHRDRVARQIAAKASAEELRASLRGEVEADLILYPKGAPHDETTRRFLTRQLGVRLAAGSDPAALEAAGVRRVRRHGDWWVLESAAEAGSALEAEAALRRLPGVLAVEVQLARQQHKRAIPNDTFFDRQWHLRNTGQGGGLPGSDVNPVDVWDSFRGAGITIAIVDDGLEHTHPDLQPAYNPALSFDFNDRDPNPFPQNGVFFGNDHGTACAGVAAARGNNSQGVSGAAYEATLSGMRLIARPTTDADEAEAFSFHTQEIHIYSNSWGPFDDAKRLEGPGPLTRAALADAVQNGRGGRGSILTWAGGNGLQNADNSNFDGYANSPETIAIGALTNFDRQAFYSESGANLVVTAPSNGGSLGITTTDRQGRNGYNAPGGGDLPNADYTNTFGGTSSACPLAAGVVALILNANPELGWRDVQEILIRSAVKCDPTDNDWRDNGAGFHFNHKYGAGRINAAAAVALAQGWTNLGPRTSAVRAQSYPAEIIPDNDPAGVEHTFVFDEAELRVEHVVVTVDLRHSARGQLEIEVESPDGTLSTLAPRRPRDKGNHLKNWPFMSVRHWGERAAGTWKVRVKDRDRKVVGTLNRIQVELFGSEAPAALRAEPVAAGEYPSGAEVTVDFGITNHGDEAVAGIIATLATDAALMPVGPAVRDYGSIAPGQTATQSFTFQVLAPAGKTIRPKLSLTSGGEVLGALRYPLLVGRLGSIKVVKNLSAPIPTSGTSGYLDPQQTTIEVPLLGVPAVITDVKVKLSGLQHARVEDLDVLLVHGTSRRSVLLMSDAGLGFTAGVDLTFSDAATVPLPAATLATGTYRPTNLGTTIDPFPGVPLVRPFGSTLGAFRELPATDLWELYIRDDKSGAAGSLAGWELEIFYAY